MYLKVVLSISSPCGLCVKPENRSKADVLITYRCVKNVYKLWKRKTFPV